MGFLAFASAKASPGVTTSVAALAASWPVNRALLVVELDPSGGDLAVRYDLPVEPGLVTLAAAGRRELDPETLLAHTQPLPSVNEATHVPRRLLAAPVSLDQASAALVALRGRLSGVLAAAGMDVLVDCGRLDHSSPVQRLATEADLLVMVVRPVVAEVHHLATRLDTLQPRNLSLLLVGEKPYSVEEVAEAVGASPLGTFPEDARAAIALTAGDPRALRHVRRSGLLRSSRAIAERLGSWMTPPPPAEAQSADSRSMVPAAPGSLPPPPQSLPPLESPPPPPPHGWSPDEESLSATPAEEWTR